MKGLTLSCITLMIIKERSNMPSLTPSNRHYLIKYEMLNTITHALGALAAIIGAILLLVKAWQQHLSSLTLTALSIYAISMIGFLLASTLFHALVFTKAGKLFQFFDHSGIYFIILGSYTPYTWLFLPTNIGWPIWFTIAGCTVLGLIYDVFFVGRWPWLSVIIYVCMGWLVVLVFPMVYAALSPTSFILLLAGGIVYTIGAIFYLLPKIPYAHVYWHIFVLIAATLMYISIYDMLF